MRWITFLILLYVMDALQVGRLGGFPDGSDHWPCIEYLAVLAIFYALYAADSAAPLCGLLCGLCYDLASLQDREMIGTTAVPLALTAFLVVRIRLSIFREHVLSQVLITFLAILLFATLVVITRLLLGAPLVNHSVWTHFSHFAANAVYSAMVAPVIYWLFFHFHSLLGFTSHGPRSRIHDARR